MGNDAALAALSDRPQLLYNYFKQLFAPGDQSPIDPIREELVTAWETTLGSEGNILEPTPESCRQLRLESPVLDDEELAKLKHLHQPDLVPRVLPMLYPVQEGEVGLERGAGRTVSGRRRRHR